MKEIKKTRIEFNLYERNFIDNEETIKDVDGNELSVFTLNSILSLIAVEYYKSKFETAKISCSKFKSINKNYILYIDFLRHKEIIYRKNYVKGVSSFGYMFSDYFKNSIKVTDIIFKSGNKGTTGKKNNGKLFVMDVDTYNKLKNDFRSIKVNVDTVEKEYNDFGVAEFKKYLRNCIGLHKIRSGYLYFKMKTGRLYSPFTFLSGQVRSNHITLSKSKLASFDIPNSYPLFLTLWCIDKGIDTNDYDFIDWCENIVAGRDKNDKNIFYKELRLKFDGLRNSDIKEKYRKDVDVTTAISKPHISYNQAKEYFQKWLNGDEQDNFINNTFKSYYSSIYDLVDKAAYKMYDELVVMESEFIFNKIVKRCYDEIEGVKILTCHDQIYFQQEYYSDVEEIWNEEIKELYSKLPIEDDVENEYSDSMEILEF